MDKFDEAVKKVKEVADIACKKTGEVITVQKQKFDILTLKNELNEVYASLGRAVYKQEGVDLQEHKDLTDKIEELTLKIKEKQDEISKINGKEFCSECGKEINQDVVFCPYCGKKI